MIKEIWNNRNLRSGGYYELAMEVSSNKEIKPVRALTKRLFQLDFISGPFNSEFKEIDLDLEYFDNLGSIQIQDKLVPFKTFSFPEDGVDGSNWLDISIYTAIYEEILGKEYQTWASDGKRHEAFDKLLIKILNELNTIHKIRVGIIGFEISGTYYLQTLKEQQLTKNDISHTKIFVNKGEILKGDNLTFVNEI